MDLKRISLKQLALRMRNNNIQSSIERVIDVVKQELQQRGSAIEYRQMHHRMLRQLMIMKS